MGQALKKFENRSSALSEQEIDARRQAMRQWQHICTFEGQHASEEDEQLFELLIQKKITRQEYIDLCRP